MVFILTLTIVWSSGPREFLLWILICRTGWALNSMRKLTITLFFAINSFTFGSNATHFRRPKALTVFFLRKYGFSAEKKNNKKMERMHLIVNLWSLRAHVTHAGSRPWMVFDYITVNDAFCYIAWPFSFHPRLGSTKIDYSFRNEWRKNTKNYNLLRTQNVSPSDSFRRFFFLWTNDVVWMYQMFFFQFFGRTKVLIWTPFHPNYYIFFPNIPMKVLSGVNKKMGFAWE